MINEQIKFKGDFSIRRITNYIENLTADGNSSSFQLVILVKSIITTVLLNHASIELKLSKKNLI